MPNRLQFLWGKITARGNQSSRQADYFQNPAAAMPPYRYRTVQHHPTADEKQYRATEQDYWQKQLRLAKELNVLTKWLNWITGIGTLVALFGLAFLWKTLEATEIAAVAARDAVTVARDTLNFTTENARLDQRAWVGVKELHLAEVPTAHKRITFVVEVGNMGKTPGLNVTTRIKFSMNPPSDLRAIDLLGINMGSYVVPPGTESYPSIVVFPGDRVLTEEEVAVLRKRKTPLYLYGLINYDDIFGEPHWTRYCGVYLHNDISPMALNWCDQKGYNAMQ